MLDARYHLFYLIAIFLMLGFGIMIGASYYGPVQVRQEKKVLDNLAAETNRVVQERHDARARLDKDESALSALVPALVRGKLAGRRVILIQTGDYADATEAANKAVTDAGATVAATVVLTDKWGALLPRQRQALATFADPSDPASQDKALLAALASALAGGTPNGPPSVLDALQGQGLMTVSGDLSQPCSLFVLVGGSRDDALSSSLDGPLLDGFKAASTAVTLVGCEPFTAASSSIPAYQNAGIATVDCIDLPLGQLALPFALRGDAGDYGLKPTAKTPLPDSLEGLSAP
ncbi:MAG: copper transporter [Armatimonadota bacterium]|nr:copper transporter [Armatimonadota bacterium]